jgi:hypothetical protein
LRDALLQAFEGVSTLKASGCQAGGLTQRRREGGRPDAAQKLHGSKCKPE